MSRPPLASPFRIADVDIPNRVLLAPLAGFAQDESDPLARVKSRGVLEVAMYADFPPWSYKGEDNRPAGVDVDIGKALAALGDDALTHLRGAQALVAAVVPLAQVIVDLGDGRRTVRVVLGLFFRVPLRVRQGQPQQLGGASGA